MGSSDGVSRGLGIGGITITLTTGLVVYLSPMVATAYASANDRLAQMSILKRAFAEGSAIPVSDAKSRVDERQLAYTDTTPRAPKRYRKKKR